MSEKIEIPAIHDDDLKSLLSKSGLDKGIDSGNVFCYVCGTSINWDNIWGLLINEGQINIVCGINDCIENMRNNIE